MLNTINLLDIAVVIFYMGLMLAIGLYFKRYMKAAKDYFAGGNLIPWWVGGISLYMSSFTAWTFTGAAGFVYHTGWFGVLYFVTWPISYFVGYRLTAARWRRSRVLSPVEYVSTRYNVATQQVLSYVLVTSGLLARGITLTAVCKIIAAATNLPLDYMIIVVGVVILLYTMHGGLWAVSVTDVVQFIFLFVITLIITPLCLKEVGGLAGLHAKMPTITFQHDYAGFTYDLHYLIAFTLVNILNVNWSAAQRYYSVIDEKAAKRVGLSCSLLFITAPILFGLPPLAAKVFWPELTRIAFFTQHTRPEDLIYLGIVLKWLPNGLIGFFLAAMFAATMSTLSGAYNVDASIIARDIYKGLLKPQASDLQMLKVGRYATVVLGVITIGTALLYAYSPLGIFNLMVIFVSLFHVPVAVPMVFGLVFKKSSRWSAMVGMVLGLVTSFFLRFALHWNVGPQIYGTLIASFLPLLLLHKFVKDSPEDVEIKNAFFAKLIQPVDVAKEVLAHGKKTVSAYAIVGVCTTLIGSVITLLAFVQKTAQWQRLTLAIGFLLIIIGVSLYVLGRKSMIRQEGTAL
jgi:solute:Na+ symporter, SSS family